MNLCYAPASPANLKIILLRHRLRFCRTRVAKRKIELVESEVGLKEVDKVGLILFRRQLSTVLDSCNCF